jgi:ATP-dependent DNA helicase RecG
MENLPFNLENILYGKTVENSRIEYKRNISDENELYVGATLCAFANDFLNQNGGWLVFGIDAPSGEPVLPPVGLVPNQIEKTQQRIRLLGKKMDPPYHPAIFLTEFEGQSIVVVYAPAGDERPYTSVDPRQAQKREYFIREGAETVKADKATLEKLIQLCAKIPFDDRINTEADITDIDSVLVGEFLFETESSWSRKGIGLETYKAMRIVGPYHDAYKPKNVGLMFFNHTPQDFCKGCYFEVVQFGDVQGGDIIEERRFTGSITNQITNVIEYLDSLTPRQTRKVRHRAEVDRFSAFPYEALEEVIVNAAYHRGYDFPHEPTKVYLYPDRMEIISYPGPVPGIEPDDFKKDAPLPPVPLRNRRMGEFLKELKLAEMRSTGVPKIKTAMKDNGSDEPHFLFDTERTYFKVVLPAHPKYVLIHALREAGYQWSIGERSVAKQILQGIFEKNTGSGSIAGQLIEYSYNTDEEWRSEEVFQTFHKALLKTEPEQPYLRYFRCLINDDKVAQAKKVINLLDEEYFFDQPIDIAVAFKRVDELEKAHVILSRLHGDYEDDFPYLRNYAEVKISLANHLFHRRGAGWSTINRLRREALDLLTRAIPLAPDSISQGWCYFNVGRLRSWLRMPTSQIDDAFKKAVELVPTENAFAKRYANFKESLRRRTDRP